MDSPHHLAKIKITARNKLKTNHIKWASCTSASVTIQQQ
jgi:hypothetical protein